MDAQLAGVMFIAAQSARARRMRIAHSFFFYRKFLWISYRRKDNYHTAAEKKYVAKATRRRRRILQSRILFYFVRKDSVLPLQSADVPDKYPEWPYILPVPAGDIPLHIRRLQTGISRNPVPSRPYPGWHDRRPPA